MGDSFFGWCYCPPTLREIISRECEIQPSGSVQLGRRFRPQARAGLRWGQRKRQGVEEVG